MAATMPIAAAQVIPQELEGKIQARQARIGIIGLGYVGLPLALLFSDGRYAVTGFDIDVAKVEKLAAGDSYIARIGAPDIQEARARGFSATTNYSGLHETDAVIICVPTPLDEFRRPDLRYIINTAESIAPHLQAGQLIVLESTTYPGTKEEVLVPILEKNNPAGLCAARPGMGSHGVFYVAFSPEREDPGNTTVARRDIPKIVGGLDNRAA